MRTVAFDRMNALVIEDDRATRILLRRMLKNLGFAGVTEAEDGTAGLTAVTRDSPNVVICDINMSPMGGIEFLSLVRRSTDARIRNMPVLFLTSQADLETVTKARDLSVASFIKKPVTPAILRERLVGALTQG